MVGQLYQPLVGILFLFDDASNFTLLFELVMDRLPYTITLVCFKLWSDDTDTVLEKPVPCQYLKWTSCSIIIRWKVSPMLNGSIRTKSTWASVLTTQQASAWLYRSMGQQQPGTTIPWISSTPHYLILDSLGMSHKALLCHGTISSFINPQCLGVPLVSAVCICYSLRLTFSRCCTALIG